MLSGKRHLDCESRQPRERVIVKSFYPAADMKKKESPLKKKHVFKCSHVKRKEKRKQGGKAFEKNLNVNNDKEIKQKVSQIYQVLFQTMALQGS